MIKKGGQRGVKEWMEGLEEEAEGNRDNGIVIEDIEGSGMCTGRVVMKRDLVRYLKGALGPISELWVTFSRRTSQGATLGAAFEGFHYAATKP